MTSEDATGWIFDFDGTLVDTMPLHYAAYRATFAEIGLELTEAQFFGNIGGRAAETIPRFLAGRPAQRTVAELHARKQELAHDLLASAPIPVLATASLLPMLHRRLPMALASSGSRAGILIVLARLGWTNFFQAIVTGEDVARGKPAPDLFLLAAGLLGVEPGQCIVFEDTDDGVAAASAAGMAVFDVRRARAAEVAL